MKINHFFFTILLCLFFFTSNCFTQTAGPPFNFYFQDTTIPVDETGCMDAIVGNFTDVLSFEFAFGNPSQLFTVADKFLIPDFNLVPASLTIGDPLNTNVNNLRLLDDLNNYPNPTQSKANST